MDVVLKVESCRQCPNSTNNAQERDDPFTSGPANVQWRCKLKDHEYNKLWIDDPNVIDPACPMQPNA